MTQNQIAYWKAVRESADRMRQLEEDTRHNKALESLTAQERAESHRSNLAKEGETLRSNLAKEGETSRSNLAKEVETNRSNLAKEQETHRSNLRNEELLAAKNNIQLQSNLEQARHNQVAESELHRANVANETLTSQRNSEAIRSNLMNEAIDRERIAETGRVANMQNAVNTYDAITRRETQKQQGTYQAKQTALGTSQALETERHNREMEAIERTKTTTQAATSIISTLGNIVGRGVGGLIGNLGGRK